jgi:hypothetical protein
MNMDMDMEMNIKTNENINNIVQKLLNVTKLNNKNMSIRGGGKGNLDLQGLTEDDVRALFDQGILPEQIAEIAIEQGQPVPPIIEAILAEKEKGGPPQGGPPQGPPQGPPPKSKASKFPAMMDVETYGQYKKVDKAERKARIGAHKPNVFGYVFSDLISEEILKDMKRTQGSFLVGVNLSNLFNEFRNMFDDSKKKETQKPGIPNKSENIFKKVGEWVDVNFDEVLNKKMGFRGSDVPLLPENDLTEYSTFYEIIEESKKFADQSGFNGKITPYGLLMMTRMLFKYRKNNAQWIRVATILELIYKYLGGNQQKEIFFNSRDNIPIMSLMDLEEFYNTDHIFMTEKELEKFKKDLTFYKYNRNLDIKQKLDNLKKKVQPPI